MNAIPAIPHPTATQNKNPLLVRGGFRSLSQAQYAGTPMQMLSGNSRRAAKAIRPDLSHKRVCRLLWAAFPGPSAAAVQRHAAAFLGKDERTIRYWMDGTTEPKWSDIAMISFALGYETAMKILFGVDV